MIERIPEYGWSILATALKGVEVDQPERWLSWLRHVVEPVEAQAFAAKRVAGRRHLYFAALFALKAFAEASNVSESLPMEALLQASAQRQVSKAIERLGIRPGKNDVAILLMSKDEGGLQAAIERLKAASHEPMDEGLLDLSPAKFEGLTALFNISGRELAAERDAQRPAVALTNLIIERMTLQASRRRAPRRVPGEPHSTARS